MQVTNISIALGIAAMKPVSPSVYLSISCIQLRILLNLHVHVITCFSVVDLLWSSENHQLSEFSNVG